MHPCKNGTFGIQPDGVRNRGSPGITSGAWFILGKPIFWEFVMYFDPRIADSSTWFLLFFSIFSRCRSCHQDLLVWAMSYVVFAKDGHSETHAKCA